MPTKNDGTKTLKYIFTYPSFCFCYSQKKTWGTKKKYHKKVMSRVGDKKVFRK